jgi:glutathione S-transferase
MLILFGRKSSFNVQKVAWLLGELETPFRHIEMGGAHGGLDTPEFRALNPHGKVPVLKDGDTVIWESHAILRYLAATRGKEVFWSADPAARARVDQWMDWSQTRLQVDFLVGVFWGFFRTPEEMRDMTAVERSVKRCADHFTLLDGMLAARDWLLQDAMTLADITIGTHLYRYLGLEIDRPSLPNVERWYAALCSRPAYVEHVMVPFDDLYGRLDY